MDFSAWIGPAVVAAVVSGIVSTVGMFVNRSTTIALADRRATTDMTLAERKFQLDADLADRKRRQDLAEEVLSGFYKMDDILRHVRSPMSFPEEAKDRRRPEYEEPGVAQQRDAYYAILARYDAKRQEISDLLSRKYRMVAWFGKEAEQPFKTLHEALVEVTTAAQMLVQRAGDREADIQFTRKLERDIWWGAATPDPVATKIATSIATMETLCRPILEDRLSTLPLKTDA